MFTKIFTLLSHKFDTVHKGAFLCLDIMKNKENFESIEELIESRQGVFWSNVFSNIRYLDIDPNSNILIFKSLKSYGPKTFIKNLSNVIEHLCAAIDHFIELNDWHSLVVIFDIVLVVSELINQNDIDSNSHANSIKDLVLRLKPFFVSVKYPRIAHNSLMVFKNLISYLSKVRLETEDAKNFSDEDPSNAILDDALSIISYKFYDDFKYLINLCDHEDNKFHDKPGFNPTNIHIHVIRLFREINKYRNEFLINGHRFYLDIADPMLIHLSKFKDNSSKLYSTRANEYIQLYSELKFQNFSDENPYESKINQLVDQIARVKDILNQ